MEENGGGWSGNGGNFNLEENNVWNLSSEPIQYCIKIDKQFPFSQKELEELVVESISDWKTFFFNYNLLNSTFNINNSNLNIQFLDNVARGINLNFKLTEKCGDNEDLLNDEVRFYFGETNKVITNYQQFSNENSLGVAIRKDYNHKSFKNGGYVWLSNFTKDKNRLKHLLLHELGHVFGMPHDSVFVMNENIADELVNEQDYESDYFGLIESPSWKYRIGVNDEVVLTSTKGRIRRDRIRDEHKRDNCFEEGYVSNSNLPPFLLNNLNMNIRGCHRITFKLTSDLVDNLNRKRTYELEITDQFSRSRFKLQGDFVSALLKSEINSCPSLFTRWNRNGRLAWMKIPLDKKLPDFPSRGYFELNRVKYAAKINSQKGPIIEIFFPQVGRWWVLKSSHNN